jgi:hypothetical protein
MSWHPRWNFATFWREHRERRTQAAALKRNRQVGLNGGYTAPRTKIGHVTRAGGGSESFVYYDFGDGGDCDSGDSSGGDSGSCD